jgi:hypothetical protein
VAQTTRVWSLPTKKERRSMATFNRITSHNKYLREDVVQTLLNGGMVYALEPDQMPDHTQLAAIFRFEK